MCMEKLESLAVQKSSTDSTQIADTATGKSLTATNIYIQSYLSRVIRNIYSILYSCAFYSVYVYSVADGHLKR